MTRALGKYTWVLLGALSIAFHIWLVFSGLVPNLISRPLHMALAAPWAMLFIPAGRKPLSVAGQWIAVGLTGLIVTSCLWIAFNQSALSDQYGYLSGNLQLVIAIVLIFAALEMARRCIGWPLPLVASMALAYALLGDRIPGEFGYPGIPLNSLLGTLTIAEGGLWGKLTGVSVNIVAVFVIFGALLNAGEAGQGFMNLASAAAGRLKGGAAKVAVISSALFGSISGSASANVASTGTVTMPAMIRLGYPKALAAAVEAVASSGGQIMPPLMGAGAFVMVELTGVSYTGIMAAAFFPALLYFVAVWIGINGFCRRLDLRPLDKDDQPPAREVLLTSVFFVVPFTALLWFMFIGQKTAAYSACWASLIAAMLLFINTNNGFSPRVVTDRLKQVCLTAGSQVATIASIILCASLIVGVLGVTGLGIKVTSTILSLSGGNLWIALALTALACLILGMEVPTTAAYVICVSVAGPALTELGLPTLTVHLFVFWFALLSTITPPVCGAVFIASGMVGENWLKVAIYAMALGLGLYLIPIAMIVYPSLLDPANRPIVTTVTALLVAVALGLVSAALISRQSVLLRAVYGVLGLSLLFAGTFLD